VTATEPNGLSSVRNAARLLKIFLSREESVGVSDLARRLGLGKSTVHRLLTTLAAEGLIERDEESGGYRLGLDGVDVVYVDRLESSQTLRLFTETGRRVPVHCTSSGKVLLAHLPPERCAQVLAEAPLTQLTSRTITDPVALQAELARVRLRGWAEAVDEREIGVASVAAPVRDRSGRVIAAISIGAPAIRLGAARRRELASVVQEAGEAASRRLGWSPPMTAPRASQAPAASSVPLPAADARTRG